MFKIRSSPFLSWLPRILGVFLIFIFGVFSLDSFSGDVAGLTKVCNFLIHNIPTIVIMIALLFSWKNNRRGAVLFFVISACLLILLRNNFAVALVFAGIPLTCSILFFMNDHI